MEFRETVDALAAAEDLLTVDAPVEDPDLAFAVAAESARSNGPAVLLTDVPGVGRLACGVRGGPDRMVRRRRLPWSRIALGMGLPVDATVKSGIGISFLNKHGGISNITGFKQQFRKTNNSQGFLGGSLHINNRSFSKMFYGFLLFAVTLINISQQIMHQSLFPGRKLLGQKIIKST